MEKFTELVLLYNLSTFAYREADDNKFKTVQNGAGRVTNFLINTVTYTSIEYEVQTKMYEKMKRLDNIVSILTISSSIASVLNFLRQFLFSTRCWSDRLFTHMIHSPLPADPQTYTTLPLEIGGRLSTRSTNIYI